MVKIKLLVDSQIFVALRKTGIYRMAFVLLKEFLKRDDIDLYLAKTTSKGNLITELKNLNLYDELKDKIVSLSRLNATTRTGNVYHRFRAKLLKIIFSLPYKIKLRKFDTYFSIFHPISSIVYNSNVKTFLVIHDIIPIVFPDSVSENFKKVFSDRILFAHPDAYFCDSKYTVTDFLKFKPSAKDTPIYTTYLDADNNFHPIDDIKKIVTVGENEIEHIKKS